MIIMSKEKVFNKEGLHNAHSVKISEKKSDKTNYIPSKKWEKLVAVSDKNVKN